MERYKFMKRMKELHPRMFTNTRVLDFGSMDRHRANRKLFKLPKEYIGIDKTPGPNVDVVCMAHQYAGEGFDVAVSTEMLQYDEHWDKSLQSMIDAVRPGGLILIACTTDNHLTEDDIKYKIAMHHFSQYEFKERTQDLLFWGVKK